MTQPRMLYAHVPGAEEEPVVRDHEDTSRIVSTGPVPFEGDDYDHDPINHPSHYCQGGIECIEAIRAALTTEEFRGFCRGNALKYGWRMGRKGDPAEDAGKARWYLERFEETF